jgi:hypothetical protein
VWSFYNLSCYIIEFKLEVHVLIINVLGRIIGLIGTRMKVLEC